MECLIVGKWSYGARPQVSRQMPRVGLKWVGRCCLSWTHLSSATLECTSPVKRFPVRTANLNNTSATKTRTIKYTHRLRYPWWTLLKLSNIKNKQQFYDGEKNKHTKYKKLNVTEHKTDMNITKINKYNEKTEQYFYNENKNKQVHSQSKRVYNTT